MCAVKPQVAMLALHQKFVVRYLAMVWKSIEQGRQLQERVTRESGRGYASTEPYTPSLRRLAELYNTTPAYMLLVRERQGQRCGICRRLPKKWHVDHDHKTMEFRGWLCHHCNVGLGFLGDTLQRLRSAVEYLEGKFTHAPR